MTTRADEFDFCSLDLGITTDWGHSGYVRFDCEKWGPPPNTGPGSKWHSVYRPLHDGYLGHEHLTEEMRAAVQEHYARQKVAENEAKERELAEWQSRRSAKQPDPEWRAHQAARARQAAIYDRVVNEGGDGYNPYRT